MGRDNSEGIVSQVVALLCCWLGWPGAANYGPGTISGLLRFLIWPTRLGEMIIIVF